MRGVAATGVAGAGDETVQSGGNHLGGRFWADVWAAGIPARKAERLARLEAEEMALATAGLDGVAAGQSQIFHGAPGAMREGLAGSVEWCSAVPAVSDGFAERAKLDAEEVLAEAREHMFELEADVQQKHLSIEKLEREIFRVEQRTAAAKLRHRDVTAKSLASESLLSDLEATLAVREAEVMDLCSAAEQYEMDIAAQDRERSHWLEESIRLEAELAEAQQHLEPLNARCAELQLRRQSCEAEGQELEMRLGALREAFADVGVDIGCVERPDGSVDGFSITLAMCRAILPQ